MHKKTLERHFCKTCEYAFDDEHSQNHFPVAGTVCATRITLACGRTAVAYLQDVQSTLAETLATMGDGDGGGDGDGESEGGGGGGGESVVVEVQCPLPRVVLATITYFNAGKCTPAAAPSMVEFLNFMGIAYDVLLPWCCPGVYSKIIVDDAYADWDPPACIRVSYGEDVSDDSRSVSRREDEILCERLCAYASHGLTKFVNDVLRSGCVEVPSRVTAPSCACQKALDAAVREGRADVVRVLSDFMLVRTLQFR